MVSPKAPWFALVVLLVCHIAVLLAGFVAPYPYEEQNRLLAFAPPTPVRFIDARHHLHLRPFIYCQSLRPGSFTEYKEDRSLAYPLYLFVFGAEHKSFGIFNSRRHLFGTEGQARIFLMGSDAYGRDVFSRLLYGGQISLFAGFLAASVSVSLGFVLGGIAGYYGGWIDGLLMRCTELFLSMPWLYLLLAVRAFLPLRIQPQQAFFLLVGVLGVLGWARPARLVRGVALTAKQHEYVLAARSFGASDFYLLRTHILPFASGVALHQALLYIPQFVLLEVTLSFFGLGVSEPVPSWGNMLSDLQHYLLSESYWWLFAPAGALMAVLLAYYRLFNFIKTNRPVF